MKSSKLNSFLIATTFISFLLCILSFITVKKGERSAVKSALLNPAYKDKVQALIIQSTEDIITLRNENNWWTCEKQGIYTYADTKTIENLISNLTKLRNLYKISDRIDAKVSLNLTDDTARIVTVIDNRGNSVSKLYFGFDDSLTSRINTSTERGKVSYETEDDISPYLKTDLNFWTIPEIFFAVKNPSNLSLSKNDLHTLKSLRHGKIHSSIKLPVDCTRVNSVLIKGQYNISQKIDFYFHQTVDGPEYFYTQNIEPEIINNNAVFEISQWTYDRITKLLKQ